MAWLATTNFFGAHDVQENEEIPNISDKWMTRLNQ